VLGYLTALWTRSLSNSARKEVLSALTTLVTDTTALADPARLAVPRLPSLRYLVLLRRP